MKTKTRHILMAMIAVLAVAFPAAAQEQKAAVEKSSGAAMTPKQLFEQQKKSTIQGLTEHISLMTKHRDCVKITTNFDQLRACFPEAPAAAAKPPVTTPAAENSTAATAPAAAPASPDAPAAQTNTQQGKQP